MTAADAKPEAAAAGDPDAAFDPATPLHPSRALTPHAVKVNATLVRRGFWPKLRRVARHVPFAEDALALFAAAMDGETPAASKATLMAALAYFVIPTDVLPDFLPALGFTDDAAVIAAALAIARRSIKSKHREIARAQLDRISGEDG